MPPFVSSNCPYCSKPNTYDLLELKMLKPGARVFRSLTPAIEPQEHEYVVTCQHCRERFKISVLEEEGKNG